jgi:hypothetical protein
VSSREEIKAAIAKLVKDGATMAADLRKKEKPEGFVFNFSYQHWYSKALPVMRTSWSRPIRGVQALLRA